MTRNHEEMKALIVEAAREVFGKFGYKKTTLDDIAASLYKAKSSIYYYFKSKEEIYEAVIKKEAEELRSELIKSISKVAHPIEKLKNYVITRMNALIKVSNLYEALSSEVLDHLDFIEKIRRKYDQEEINLLKEILEGGVKQGVFRIENSELTSIAIVTALKGLEVPLFWTGKRTNAEKQLEELLNVLFYGIIK